MNGKPAESVTIKLTGQSWAWSDVPDFKVAQIVTVLGLPNKIDTDEGVSAPFPVKEDERCWHPAPDDIHLCGLDEGHTGDHSHPSLDNDWDSNGWVGFIEGALRNGE